MNRQYIYDPFKPQLSNSPFDNVEEGWHLERRLNLPVRLISIGSLRAYLIKGVFYNPSQHSLKASKNHLGKTVFNKTVPLEQDASSSEIAPIILTLTNELLEAKNSINPLVKPKKSTLKITIKHAKNSYPRLSVARNLHDGKVMERSISLKTLPTLADALSWIESFDTPIRAYLASGSTDEFNYEDYPLSECHVDSNLKAIKQTLRTRLIKRAGWLNENVATDEEYYSEVSQLSPTHNSNEKSSIAVDKKTTLVSRPQRSSGVVGVTLNFDRRSLALKIGGIINIRDKGFYQAKYFYLTRHSLEDAFRLAKKAFCTAFHVDKPSRTQYLNEFNALKDQILLTVPASLLHQVANGLEGHSCLVDKEKQPKLIDVTPEELYWIRKKLRNGGRFKAGKNSPNHRGKKSLSVQDEAQFTPSSDEVESAYQEAHQLLKEIELMQKRNKKSLDEFKDAEYGFSEFGYTSPLDVPIAKCERCGSDSRYTVTDGGHLVSCTKCLHKGAVLAHEWRAKLDWNRKNTKSIILRDIPHFHLKNRTVENSLIYMRSVEKFLFSEIDKRYAKRDLSSLIRKYKLDLNITVSKPGKTFIERLEAYGEWYWITIEVLNRYELLGKTWLDD